jgi:DNA-binding protein H-NS
MEYDKMATPEYLQAMRKKLGDAEFLRFTEMVKSEGTEAERRVKEREEARKAIDDKIDTIHELIIGDAIICDKEKLKMFLLDQLDDKYSPAIESSSESKDSKAKKESEPKYRYKTEEGNIKTWTGYGRTPKGLADQIKDENGNIIALTALTPEEKSNRLKPFLINKEE